MPAPPRSPPLGFSDVPTPTSRYRLSFAACAQHLIDVEATFVAEAPGPMALQLPVWTPGSYMVREYARHVEGLRASDGAGHPLRCRKEQKDGWVLEVEAKGEVVVHYRVYARELSVRTNYVDDAVALVQGAATFVRPPAVDAGAFEVVVHLPHGWAHALCALPAEVDGRLTRFVAPDYDTLVDSPLLLGNPRLRHFDVDGVHHTLATVGGEGLFDDAAAARELARIVAEERALFGSLPYDRYVMMNVLLGGYGGLEHKSSAMLLSEPTLRARPQALADWWGLLAHELLHAWNVKRLRPKALGPFDYGRENYTDSLWVAEGLTAYYDDLVVRRTGLIDDADYFARLAKTVETLARTPGQAGQSLTEASRDAWIKLYRRDENTDNTTVSYYLKGSLVGLCIDARLRRLSGGARSLDDVMRLAWQRFSGARGYDEAEFRACIDEVAGASQGRWLASMLDARTPLVLHEALDTFGLQLQFSYGEGQSDAVAARPTLWGVRAEVGGGRLQVAAVRRDAPAYAAGINVGDELLAVDGWRLPAGPQWPQAVADFAAGAARASLLVARLGKLRTLEVPLEPPPKERATLRVHPDAEAGQVAARTAWLQANAVHG